MSCVLFRDFLNMCARAIPADMRSRCGACAIPAVAPIAKKENLGRGNSSQSDKSSNSIKLSLLFFNVENFTKFIGYIIRFLNTETQKLTMCWTKEQVSFQFPVFSVEILRMYVYYQEETFGIYLQLCGLPLGIIPTYFNSIPIWHKNVTSFLQYICCDDFSQVVVFLTWLP